MTFTPICDPFLDSFPSPTFSLPTNTTPYITHQPPPLLLRPTAPIETPITSYHLLTYLLVPLPPPPPPPYLSLVPLYPWSPSIRLPPHLWLCLLILRNRTLPFLTSSFLLLGLSFFSGHFGYSHILALTYPRPFPSPPLFDSCLLRTLLFRLLRTYYTPSRHPVASSPTPPCPVWASVHPTPLPPLVPEPLHLLLHCIMSAGISAIYIALRDPR